MMRKVFAVALMTAMFGAASAQAGTTYDFVFRDSGTNTLTFNTATVPATSIMDVYVRTSDPLIFASTSVGWDTSNGLSIVSATEWSGINTGSMMTPTNFAPIAPGVGVDNVAGTASSFDGSQPPPNAPPSLPAGTYNIGTIVWSLPGTGSLSAIGNFILGGIDATGAVFPGSNIQDVTGQEVLGTGFVNIVPEPATAGLLGLGLAGLVLAGRRRRA